MADQIVTHPERIQPYTVWFRGEVVKFCFIMQEAKDALRIAKAATRK